jgi:hypothetical protein
MIQLKPVATKADWKLFIDLPWSIYGQDPCWVPPLRVAVRDLLDVRKNPFFRHATMHPLIAIKNGRCVARIVGIVDDKHNEFHGEKTGFFGFFESIDDQAVVNLLLDEVSRWVKERGMVALRGPVNPSTNYECGLLVDGFSDPPSVMMTYNPGYYTKLLETWGLSKAKDLFAYELKPDSRFSTRLLAQSERLKTQGAVTFRCIDMRRFDDEVAKILEIYNDAWEKNWGFVPMDPDEFRHMAKDMKAIVDPNLLLVAEVRGQIAGFGMALPDVNQVFKKIPDGKLFPTGLAKLLWNLKGPGRKRTINRMRIVTLGIKQAYREAGIGPLLYTEYLKRGVAGGYRLGEASWILEDNRPMNRALELMGAKRTKVYRIYGRAFA